MSLRRPAKNQPENFEFNASSLEAAKSIVAKYPEGKQQSAVMALLYLAKYNNAITALCCLPSGYLATILFAASNEEALNSKFSGWFFAGLLKLIYRPPQKLYQVNQEQQAHLLTCDL